MASVTNQSSEEQGLMSSINVTPFVDVALVLLVIFMVTAPILAKDVLKLHLPKTQAGDGKATTTLGLSVNREGQILLNGGLISETSLTEEVKKAVASAPETQAIISADTETKYGNVVRVIDIVKSAGLTKFAIQVEHK
jgi:biopolymer transport protein TolR